MIGIREVLCATGIDRPAHTALRYAFLVAEHFNAALDVVHARALVKSGSSNLYLSAEQLFVQLKREQHSLGRLDTLIRAVPAGATGRATPHVVDGTVVDAVIGCSERYHSDVIVLGGNPTRKVESGCVARRVGERTLRPVLTVPDTRSPAMPRIQRILCPMEVRSKASMDAMKWAALFARSFGAAVELLHAREADATSGGRYDSQEALRVAGVGAVVSFCPRTSSLTAECLRRVTEGSCDLIVISATARNDRVSPVLAALRRDCGAPILSVQSTRTSRIFSREPVDTSSTGEGYGLDARA
ncbi:MAG TPA: universal stress protein, partial [Polyangiaceae bacterium]